MIDDEQPQLEALLLRLTGKPWSVSLVLGTHDWRAVGLCELPAMKVERAIVEWPEILRAKGLACDNESGRQPVVDTENVAGRERGGDE